MFEQVFKEQVARVTDQQEMIENLWTEVEKKYSKPGRHYHTLSHLEDLLLQLSAIKDSISDWQTLIFAIAYHDIIYDPLKHNNEEKSAQVAFERLSGLSASANQRQKCYWQIMATKHHQLSDDDDTNFFTDADLAILGYDEDRYTQYCSQIRKEYKLYPDFVYKGGRQKVLRHFLQMKHIYKTDYFRDKYEQQARENLNTELLRLS